MADQAHAEHDVMRSTDANPVTPPTQAGIFYPEDDIVAVIADHAEAERAVEAMKRAGIPAGDIDLVEGERVLELAREIEANRSLLGRVGAAISFVFSESGEYQKEYTDEAALGHHVLVVHAPEHEVVERARGILRRHHARVARHYGALAVEDLIP